MGRPGKSAGFDEGSERSWISRRGTFMRLRRGVRGTEGVECFSEKSKHARGVIGGQNAAAVAFEQMLRRVCRAGGLVEGPAQMLSRVAKPDLDAVERERFAVKRVDKRKLLAQAWRL